MASKKRESEAFNLLNLMYNDDDDDMEDVGKDEDEYEGNSIKDLKQPMEERPMNIDETAGEHGEEPVVGGSGTILYSEMDMPPLNADSAPKGSGMRPPTPQSLFSSSVPESEGMLSDSQGSRKDRLTIVDYGHDEVALSPEAEEGEIVGSGRVRFGEELQVANADIEERPLSERVQNSTPNMQLTPQSSVQVDMSPSDANNDMKELEVDASEGVNKQEGTDEEIDALDKFLPPPPKEKCSQDLQDRINKFLAYKRLGRSFNAEVRNRKDYRNPDFLLHAVRYQDIDQIGSCFRKEVFDPHGYDERDYYDAIEVDMKREMERKEQERKKSQKVEFVPGGTQAAVLAAQKINMAVSGVHSSGLQSATTTTDVATREGRQNKKSKWDKVDGDRRNTAGGSHDTMPAMGSHAALLSAANAGAGYSVFAQQKRQEAEQQKRSSERKVDKRS